MAKFTDLSFETVELPAGKLRYRRAGSGSPLLFVHGLFVSGDLWAETVDLLSDTFDCIVPELPLGAHRTPMNRDADLSPAGLARLVADFIRALGLDRPALIGNDTGGAVAQGVAVATPELIGGLVLTPCDTLDDFPPKEFSFLTWVPRVPGLMWLMTQMNKSPKRLGATLHNGKLAKHRIGDETLRRFAGLAARDGAIRRDAGKACLGCDPRFTRDAAEKLRRFDNPILLVWGDGGCFPLANAQELARTWPSAQLEIIEDCWVFAPLDQPAALARHIREFVSAEAPGGRPADLKLAAAKR